MMKGGEALSTELKCPKCGKEMEEGYISPWGMIDWVSGKDRPITEGMNAIELLIMPPGGVYYYHKAHRCRSCELLLLNYHHKETKSALDIIHSRKE
jgi:phage FluMu protein Com